MDKENKNKIIYTIAAVGLIVLIMVFIAVSSKKPQGDQGGNNQNQGENGNNGEQSNLLRPIDSTDHVWGNENAPVKIIIYDDFECPFCAEFYKTTKQIKEEFGDNVAIAYRHYPLASHPNALPAALSSECADEQGKFWEMYDRLFSDNIAGTMSPEQFKKDAAEIGLDQVKFNQCLDSQKFRDKVTAQIAEGKNIGVSGTPTVFVNGDIYPGAYPMDDFKDRQGDTVKGMRNIIKDKLGI